MTTNILTKFIYIHKNLIDFEIDIYTLGKASKSQNKTKGLMTIK